MSDAKKQLQEQQAFLRRVFGEMRERSMRYYRRSECCDECAFFVATSFEEVDSEGAVYAATGECRRNAPTGKQHASGVAMTSAWPDVDPDHWCGEFKQNAKRFPRYESVYDECERKERQKRRERSGE